jgi:hypothetical protein
MPKKFEIRREVDLPASPEEVWDAVATDAGNAAWLFPAETDPDSVTASERPYRFAVREEGEGGWFNMLEFVIEGREGGTTVLRYVHSGVFDEENWDDQYDAVNQHTDFYLHTLGQYLRHFGGRTATYVGEASGGIEGPPASNSPDAFDRLKHALGISAGVGEGDRVQVDLDGAGRLEGVVDYLRPNFVGIRTADGLYRFFGRNAFGGPVAMAAHLFSDDADREQTAGTWRAWLDGVYATPGRTS